MMSTNAIRIAEIDNKLPQPRAQRTNAETERSQVRTTIEVLTAAKNKLSTALDHYLHFPSDYAALHEPVQTSHFKGSNRRSIESGLDQIKTDLENEENCHHEQLEAIKTRLTREGDQEMTLTGRVNSLSGQISGLEHERRRLVLSS